MPVTERTARAQEMARTMRRVVVAALCVVFLALFALWRVDGPRAERIRLTLVDRIAPAFAWTDGPARMLDTAMTDWEAFARLAEQNAELRRELDRMRGWRESARQLEEENARLRALNNVRLAPATGFTTGEVIADSGGPFLHTALVNVGALDGVQEGAAVMDGGGLAGRVAGRGDHAARILLVTDHSSRIPVVVRPSGARAILTGDGLPTPKLEFLEDPEAVRPGDRIVTSGDGRVFPPDLLVGLVIVGPGPRALPRARLAADVAGLEFVRVLRYAPETEIDRPVGLVLGPRERADGDAGEATE